MIITSRENKVFKLAKLLKTSKGRNEKKLFLIEGIRSVRDAIGKRADIDCIILKDGTRLDFDSGCTVYTFAPRLFSDICDTVSPQGVLAICRMKETGIEEILKTGKKCVVMCETLQDPGNIGTIIRTAHAADCGGVILTKGCCDLYNTKIIRATMTGVFSIPVVQNISSIEAIEYFKQNGYKIVAGALSDNCVNLYEADLSGKVMIVIGNEGNGIARNTLSVCDCVVKIPMRSDAESLNASVAGSVMIYEHCRQNIKNL